MAGECRRNRCAMTTDRALELAAEIERHDGGMTPGPCEAERSYVHFRGSLGGCIGVISPVDAAGIAYLRNAAPDVARVLRGLIAECEAMRAVVEAAERWRDSMGASGNHATDDLLIAAVDVLRARRGML